MAALACGRPPEPAPLPRVVSVQPRAPVPPDAVKVEIAFSGALSPDGVDDGRYVGLCRTEDLRDLAALAEADAGLAGDPAAIPARIALEAGGTTATLVPAAPLEPHRAYAAIVSKRVRAADGRAILDAEGKARTIVVPVQTADAVDRTPPAARWLTPPHGPVPRDLAGLEVGFDEPVTGALAIAGRAGVTAGTAADGEPATRLRLGLAAPLDPGPLALDLSSVRDAAGNEATAPAPLTVSRCASAGPPALRSSRLASLDLGVRVDAVLGGMGRLAVEVAQPAGAAACGAVPAAPATARFTGDVAACPGYDPCRPEGVDCPSSVALTGICPGAALRLRLATVDLAGHAGAFGPWLDARTLPPRPLPVVSEVLADADKPEAGGEYAEIANLGTGPVDLTGWRLSRRTPSGGTVRCELGPASAPLGPAGFALAVGGAYDGRYALSDGVPVHRCGSGALLGGLADDRPAAVTLEAPDGTVTSTLGVAQPGPRCPAASLERVDPAGGDATANLACGAPSPGRCNVSTPAARCPVRGW